MADYVTSTGDPALRSLVFDRLPRPDFADIQVLPLPAGASTDPRWWAEQIFAIGHAPKPVVALMALRQALVGLIGVSRGDQHAFDVVEVVGEEALMDTDDRHLRFCCGVGVDAGRSLLRVTTGVELKGWRGRVYFAPVSVLHGPVVRAMTSAAIARTTGRQEG